MGICVFERRARLQFDGYEEHNNEKVRRHSNEKMMRILTLGREGDIDEVESSRQSRVLSTRTVMWPQAKY